MNVEEFIEKLREYNPKAKIEVIAQNRAHEFSMAYGSSEGVTKETCESVSLYVDDLNNSESERATE